MTGLKLGTNHGFTIIELLVYLGLFAILIGGAMVGVYQIVESTNRNQAFVTIEQEGNFLQQKIKWSLNGATDILLPAPASIGPNMSVTSPDSSKSLSFSDGTLSLSQNGQPAVPLNSQNIKVENLTFENLAGQGVKAEFDLRSLGQARHFSTVNYLRK